MPYRGTIHPRLHLQNKPLREQAPRTENFTCTEKSWPKEAQARRRRVKLDSLSLAKCRPTANGFETNFALTIFPLVLFGSAVCRNTPSIEKFRHWQK